MSRSWRLLLGIALLVLFVFVWFLFRSAKKAADKSRRDYEQNVEPKLRIIRSLPLEVAKERALKALSNEDQFDCVVDPVGRFDGEQALAPELRDFFRRFASAQPKSGDLRFERAKVGPPEFWPDWLHIAWDEDDETLAKPNEENLYLVYAGSKPRDAEVFASVYHIILADSLLLSEE